jgi:hypothetical protein
MNSGDIDVRRRTGKIDQNQRMFKKKKERQSPVNN